MLDPIVWVVGLADRPIGPLAGTQRSEQGRKIVGDTGLSS